MQLELKRRIGETSNQFQLESVTIERYQSLCQAPNLLIVKNDFTAINDDNGNHAHREIFKPVFIASCKTRFENQLLVLFYYAAPFELKGYVIGGLPKIYENSEDGVCIVDYKSYCDICDITNETKMSLIKYYEII